MGRRVSVTFTLQVNSLRSKYLGVFNSRISLIRCVDESGYLLLESSFSSSFISSSSSASSKHFLAVDVTVSLKTAIFFLLNLLYL